jgi:hypothetical protein
MIVDQFMGRGFSHKVGSLVKSDFRCYVINRRVIPATSEICVDCSVSPDSAARLGVAVAPKSR